MHTKCCPAFSVRAPASGMSAALAGAQGHALLEEPCVLHRAEPDPAMLRNRGAVLLEHAAGWKPTQAALKLPGSWLETGWKLARLAGSSPVATTASWLATVRRALPEESRLKETGWRAWAAVTRSTPTARTA